MMIEGFLQRRDELQRKVLFAPRGPRRREALNQLRELVRQELVAEQRAHEAVGSGPIEGQPRKAAASAPSTSTPEPPPEFFDRVDRPKPAQGELYGGQQPYWVRD